MGLSTATANLGRAVARVQDLALRTILRKTGGAICSQAIEDGIRIFEACATSAPAIMAISATAFIEFRTARTAHSFLKIKK